MKPYQFVRRMSIATRFANAVLDIVHSKLSNEEKVVAIEQALERQDRELELWGEENK